ncbi:MAG: gliding motility-associated-like protein [Polaribacter sp.]|jgi:gliding motility-associated-like protein
MKSLVLPFLLCLVMVLAHSTIAKTNIAFSNNCDDLSLDISVTPAYDVILSCDNIPITLQASGSSSNGTYSIGWIDQVGQSVLIVSEPGLYTAVITDIATGCTATASSFIELIDNIPLVDAGNNMEISCLDPCTTLTATIGGNSNVLAIKWIGPNDFCSNELEPEVCLPGDYILSVHEENGGCTVYDTISVVEAYSSINNMHTETVCPGACATFAGTEFCEVGEYELVFQSWQGCDSVISLSVNEINVLADIAIPDVLNCLNNQVFLSAQNAQIPSGAQYFWASSDGHFKETPNSLSPSVDAPGTYILHINTLENCTATDTVVVVADRTVPNITAGDDTQLDCPNQIAIINGVIDSTLTAFDLKWSGPDNFSSGVLENEVNAIGAYTLRVTNLQNGCFTDDGVIVGPPEVVTIDLTTEQTCWNEDKGKINITLTEGGSAPYLYSLDALNYQYETNFQQLSSGSYTVYWKDREECGGATQIIIPEIPPIQNNLEDTYHICTDSYTTLNAAANLTELQSEVNYKWNTGATTPVVRTNLAGEYWVETRNQCETVHQDVRVINDYIPAKESIYIPSAFSPNGDLINDVFQAYLKHDLIHFEMKIFDRRGSLMFSSEDPTIGWDGTLKGEDAHGGVYAWYIDYIVSTCEGGRDRAFFQGDVTLLR